MSQEHSPLPYSVHVDTGVKGETDSTAMQIIDSKGRMVCYAWAANAEDAEELGRLMQYIVTACNMHEKLVNLCQDVLEISTWQSMFDAQNTARALLAEAKGETA